MFFRKRIKFLNDRILKVEPPEPWPAPPARVQPTCGRIVLYRLSKWDVENNPTAPRIPAAANQVLEGDIVPLLVVKVWLNEYGDGNAAVNGQAFLDGPDTLWVTSRAEGTANGTWHWPPKVV